MGFVMTEAEARREGQRQHRDLLWREWNVASVRAAAAWQAAMAVHQEVEAVLPAVTAVLDMVQEWPLPYATLMRSTWGVEFERRLEAARAEAQTWTAIADTAWRAYQTALLPEFRLSGVDCYR